MTTTVRVTGTGPISIPTSALRTLAPFIVGVFASLVSLIAITVPSVWYDEVATISSATRSWPQLWLELHNVDAVHALYYAGLHVWFDLVGYSPLTLRLPSALAVGVAAAFTVVLGRQLGRGSLGIVGGLVFAMLPRVVWAGGEGRSYAFTAMAAVILTVVFMRASRSGGRGWVLYSALAVASVVLFVYLALMILAHGIATVLMGRSRRRWTVAAASAGLISVPFVFYTLGQKAQIDWLPGLTPSTIGQVLRDQWFMSVPLFSTVFAIVAWFLIAVGVATVLRSRRMDARAAVLLPAFAIPTAVLLAATVASFPVYTPRYLTMSLPFVALVIAATIDAAPWRTVRMVALAVVVALAIPLLVADRAPLAKEASSWSEVAALIEAEKTAVTAIVYGNVQKHPSASTRVIEYAYPDAFRGTVDATLVTPAAETGRLWETRVPLAYSLDRLARADNVFLITSHARDLRASTSLTLLGDGWHQAESWEFEKLHVVRYAR